MSEAEKEWEVIKASKTQRKSAIKLSKAYFQSRKEIRKHSKPNHLLYGNDNFIGRIAEMLVIQDFLAKDHQVHRPKSQSLKGVDLVVDKASPTPLAVSVKAITYENKSGRSSKVTKAENLRELLKLEDHQNPQFVVMLVLIGADFDWCIHDVTHGKWTDRKGKYITRKDVEG
jgi:hypothetical protein